jgi:hypothetical protein
VKRGREAAHRRPRASTSTRHRPARLARDLGARCWPPAPRSRSTADHVPLQGHDRRRLLRLRGLDQFRQPLVPLNDEATLNIVDAAFAREQTATFEADLARSRGITFAEWNERPLKERLMERLASMLDSQL